MDGQRYATAVLKPEMNLHPLYRRQRVPQGLSGRARKISFPLEFDLQTVHPVASCYTKYAFSANIFR
jgi:hypothetical protein